MGPTRTRIVRVFAWCAALACPRGWTVLILSPKARAFYGALERDYLARLEALATASDTIVAETVH